MKISPVSGDLLVKLALGVLVVGGVVYAVRQAAAAWPTPGKLWDAATGAAEGVAVGTVVGIGKTVGIPETDVDQCEIDLANGDLWKASFSCPAPRYLKAITSGDYGPRNTGGATGSW